MEDLRDLVPIITSSLGFALAVTIAVCVPVFIIQRLVSFISSSSAKRTAQADMKPVKIIAAVVFTLTLIVGVALGTMSSDMCGTGDVTEVNAPGGKHKIVVYNFDCGATTDFSLNVSMLRGDQSLPRHKTAAFVYTHYHQRPVNSGAEKNFQVDWLDSTHVVVRVAHFDGQQQTRNQDGVEIAIQPLP